MMGIVMPETCLAYKTYNKIISGIYLVFYSSVTTMMHGPINIRLTIVTFFGLVEIKGHTPSTPQTANKQYVGPEQHSSPEIRTLSPN